MPFIASFLRRIYLSLGELAWSALFLILVLHLVLSYLLFMLAGEGDLVGRPVDFVYYYMVTATTVGYGDLSPKSAPGRLITVLIVLPGGIAIFTAVLGKLLTAIGTIWRNRMRGLGDYSERAGHIIVVGWQEGQTHQTLRLLHSERHANEPMSVLVAKDLPENPATDYADYIRSDRLADADALTRAGIAQARAIIARGANDDETLAAVLIAEDHAPNAHIVAYFDDDRTAQMVKQLRPRVEAVGSLAEELLSRSARDPGSSEIAARLLSAASTDTAFSLPVPPLQTPLLYGEVFLRLKRRYNVTLVGMLSEGMTDLNCRDETPMRGGETLYYISGMRLDPAAIAWARMGDET
ncbi:voltage-gated potassium channel protein (plasmid) [Rhizobium phaseoli]|uniref:Voltage-gated potassium channel protein n=2 Tax=Rhizobium TaxID=379 RepID=A0ABN4QW57_9HYPH|nr:ion channel [Rhizobium phaseoli]ACE94435.1 putative cation transporter (potassium channel) protein [Rhizobium etli CIAT 652]ANL31383.1 voltage-gated potassium channel protein [Rhizobium phaseoli]ANL37837.1 voltage-gated potassium channel protein [Rhizobium phaseoli]ANL56835.1 voltage-gated potassium channel protein [Rhizobium phaseoli]ANL88608.1 voltage-gated potassium channel protein [Rhizobium phaseoli]